jgi:hypothetical protein
MTTWDASFELSPADLDEVKYGAGKIRELKTAISEREELEHNFKTGTQPFHKAGKCAVVYVGTTAQINALTGMTEGSIAWDTTLKVIKIYTSSAWTVLDYDHGQLSGRTDDDHTQYLMLTKAGQNLSEDLTVTAAKKIDGRDISVDGALLDIIDDHYVVNYFTHADATLYTCTTLIPEDDTIPQITEGDQVLSGAITPASALNWLKIDIDVVVSAHSSSAHTVAVALFDSGAADAIAVAFANSQDDKPAHIHLSHMMAAGVASLKSFTVRVGSAVTGVTVNGVNGTRRYGGAVSSRITIVEYKV